MNDSLIDKLNTDVKKKERMKSKRRKNPNEKFTTNQNTAKSNPKVIGY